MNMFVTNHFVLLLPIRELSLPSIYEHYASSLIWMKKSI